MKAILESQGRSQLAADVARFITDMAPPATERELIARELLEHARAPHEVQPPAR